MRKVGTMRRKSCFVSPLLIMCIISACGKTEINYDEISGVSSREKEQQYIEYLTDEIKGALSGYDGINNLDMEITGDTAGWNVNVKIDYAESLSNVTELNQSIEEVLEKFLPEGTNLSVVAE